METSQTLYDLLGIVKDASIAQIKKAFREMSLKVHPDKHSEEDKQQAEKNFNKLKQAYEILISPEKRRLYDLTGDVEDAAGFFEAYDYYREVYHRVTFEDISTFATTYKGSTAEEEDLINFYRDFKGDMTQILMYIPLSEASDLPRFFETYDELIDARELPRRKAYKVTKNAVRMLEEEIGEEILAEKTKPCKAIKNDLEDLANTIKANAQSRRSFLEDLEDKYCQPKKLSKVRHH